MRTFKHLSLEEREKLYGGLRAGLSIRKIAKRLGRHHTSLIRELKTNSKSLMGNPEGIRTYLPCKAHEKATKRKIKQRTKAPLKDSLIFVYVREHLRGGWSPEQIAGRLPIDHPVYSVDDETIYRYIYSGKVKRFKLWRYLVRARKKRMKKEGRRVRRDGKIPGSISIDLRPKEVDERVEPGHWETDNMIGKQTDTSALSTTTERVTLATLIDKLANKGARAKTKALVKRLSPYPKVVKKTLTMDNGKENSYHQRITNQLGLEVYFTHAYHSWEKGTVENTNGRIRRYIPKGVSIDTITNTKIKKIEERVNNTPRKCLGFLTPYEKMREVLSTLSTQ